MKKLIFLLLFLPFSVKGVCFNEIAWMGTENSSTDEWIELYSEKEVALDGWKITAEDGSPEIILKGKINGFYLLERTAEDTIPDIKADLIYKGSLSNKGEKLTLYNAQGKTVDEIDCQEEWLEGNNNTKQTMEKNKDSWQTSLKPGGTPKKENSTLPKKSLSNKKPEEKIPQAFFPIFPAFFIALFSSIIMVFLKISIKKEGSFGD